MFGFFKKKEQPMKTKAPIQQDLDEGKVADLQAKMEKLESQRDALGVGIDALNAERNALMARLKTTTVASDKNALARQILLLDKQIKAKDNLRRTYDEKISGVIDALAALGNIAAANKGGTEDVISADTLLDEVQKAAEKTQAAAVKAGMVRDATNGLTESGFSSEMEEGLEGILAEAEGSVQTAPAAPAVAPAQEAAAPRPMPASQY